MPSGVNRRPFLPVTGTPETQKDFQNLIADLLAARATMIPGRDNPVQSPDILAAIQANLSLAFPIQDLNLNEIQFVIPIGNVGQTGVPFAVGGKATFTAGASTLSTFWWNIEIGDLVTSDGAESATSFLFNGTKPGLADFTRYDSIAIDFASGQPATSAPIEILISSGGNASFTQGSAAPAMVTNGIPVAISIAPTRTANYRIMVQGPIFVPATWGLTIVVHNTQVLAGGGTTVTVAATGFKGNDGQNLGQGGTATIHTYPGTN